MDTMETYTENEIIEVSKQGISLKNGVFIDFSECAENFAKKCENKTDCCVGERDISKYIFVFYTSPKPVVIQFIKKNAIGEFFAKTNTRERFHNLQKKICEYGYLTYDLS